MRVFILSLATALALIFVYPSLAFNNPTIVSSEVCFRIKNDTGESVTFHTGKGTTVLNNLAEKEFCMEEGETLHLAEKGKKGKVVVEVTSKIKGKKFKLSELL